MQELLRTNDLVLISLVESLLAEQGVGVFVADQHMSTLEGSTGFMPRRVMVVQDELSRAQRILVAAGLAEELSRV